MTTIHHRHTNNRKNLHLNLRKHKILTIEDNRRNKKQENKLELRRETHHHRVRMDLHQWKLQIMKRSKITKQTIDWSNRLFDFFFSLQISKLESDIQRLNQSIEKQKAAELQLRTQLNDLKNVRKDLEDIRTENGSLQTK